MLRRLGVRHSNRFRRNGTEPQLKKPYKAHCYISFCDEGVIQSPYNQDAYPAKPCPRFSLSNPAFSARHHKSARRAAERESNPGVKYTAVRHSLSLKKPE